MARAFRCRRDPARIRFPPTTAVPGHDDTELSDRQDEPGLKGRSASEDHDPRWNSWRTNFDIRISELVWREACRGNPEAAERRLELLAGFPFLEVNERADALSERLLRDCRLPAHASIDAAHVAVAAVHDMEILLTWNFAHLVNTDFAPRIRSVCEREGHACPLLCTPEQLMGRYEHEHTR